MTAKTPRELLETYLTSHPVAAVERRYQEIESFVLAQCHACGANPLEFELVVHQQDPFTTVYTIRRKDA